MNLKKITSIDDLRQYLNLGCSIKISGSKEKIYQWLKRALSNINYHHLRKKEKGIAKSALCKITGYSAIQMKRLISEHKQNKLIWQEWERKNTFQKKYSPDDLKLLNQVDKEHKLSGKATKVILEREYAVSQKEEYNNIRNISVSHMYNLRHTYKYKCLGTVFKKTLPAKSYIGIRKKPIPNGRPGYLRVDSVHQGKDNSNSQDGIYHINIVDEVTQMEYVFDVPDLTDDSIVCILEKLYKECQFKIINFHSDNGKEYINYLVAGKLQKLYIIQTKSRARKTNDNALVESKNAAIVRKTFGYNYIPASEQNLKLLNNFCVNYLNPYVNFHRPSGFATTVVDYKGRIRKIYDTYMTPYEKLKSLYQAEQYLKDGVTFKQLDKIANEMSDTEFARKMNEAKIKLFQELDFNLALAN
jgi:hypothetical protein